MAENVPRLSALDDISVEMRKKLRVVIEQHHPNFVLVGSDPSEEGGCCPSTDVGHANALVAAGILESWQAGCGKDACPGTFYAFAGERVPETSPTEYKTNDELRARVAERLGKTGEEGGLLKKGVQTLLLLFVAVCVGVLVARDMKGEKRSGGGADASIAEAASSLEDGYLISVVKTARSCSSCETMEANAQKTLRIHYSEEVKNGRILYASVAAYGDENRDFRGREGILATSLVLMEVKNGEVMRSKVLSDIWQVLNKEEAFIDMLNTELGQFAEDIK